MDVTVRQLGGDEWSTLRALRLRALTDSPQSFASTFDEEVQFDEAAWRRELVADHWCAAIAAETAPVPMAVALMGVAPTDRHGCDCWIHGCWVDPRFRRQGLTRRMVDWLDELSMQRGWLRQGLGVWPDNTEAIAAWERLGFSIHGAPLPSRRRPGKTYVAMLRDVP
jgi:GNAT superfamily N-acetyltransferase